MRIVVSIIVGLIFLSAPANALTRFAGLKDGSDINLRAVCEDYMINSYLKNDPDLFFHLLPKSMVSREAILEKDWSEWHQKLFGNKSLIVYDYLKISEKVRHYEYKGLKNKSIGVKYKAGIMPNKKGSSCNFRQHKDGRWYFAKKP